MVMMMMMMMMIMVVVVVVKMINVIFIRRFFGKMLPLPPENVTFLENVTSKNGKCYLCGKCYQNMGKCYPISALRLLGQFDFFQPKFAKQLFLDAGSPESRM